MLTELGRSGIALWIIHATKSKKCSNITNKINFDSVDITSVKSLSREWRKEEINWNFTNIKMKSIKKKGSPTVFYLSRLLATTSRVCANINEILTSLAATNRESRNSSLLIDMPALRKRVATLQYFLLALPSASGKFCRAGVENMTDQWCENWSLVHLKFNLPCKRLI